MVLSLTAPHHLQLNDVEVKKHLRGEMEKDAVVSHGTMKSFKEKFYDHSDGFDIYVCKRCGRSAIYNELKKIYRCKTCGSGADIIRTPSSWMTNIVFSEINASNIDTKFRYKPAEYY